MLFQDDLWHFEDSAFATARRENLSISCLLDFHVIHHLLHQTEMILYSIKKITLFCTRTRKDQNHRRRTNCASDTRSKKSGITHIETSVRSFRVKYLIRLDSCFWVLSSLVHENVSLIDRCLKSVIVASLDLGFDMSLRTNRDVIFLLMLLSR